MKGKFITFEGPEGGGKSTQIKELAAFLEARGIPVLQAREPGGTRLGERVRGLLQDDTAGEPPSPRAEVLLFLASRAQLVANVIVPALEKGVWVLCDRFDDSTFAYQGYGRGFDLDALRCLDAFATGGLVPDLTLLLDLPPDVGFARLATRQAGEGSAPDRFEREARAFHERLRAGFLELAGREPGRIAVIDAGQPRETVAGTVREMVAARFGIGREATR
ncbi:MAG: dTMP kinase [Kiritimatiellae bacterium]|nr:dTMP kinase [Kiritimatiellia bacterium]